jgi:Domain of unknown function (DUF4349)
MSQLDLIAEIRAHPPVAPAELRERVRQLAADAPAQRRRFTRRRALVVAIAVAGLAAAAGVLGTRDSGTRSSSLQPDLQRTLSPPISHAKPSATREAAPAFGFTATDAASGAAVRSPGGALKAPAGVPPPSASNAQRYSATLSLRLKDAAAISAATNKALRVVAAMGGHPNTVNVDAERRDGEAYLVLKVPRTRVQEAVQKLGALGTIVGANVSIQDLQAGIDTTGRTIDRLQAQLAELRAQTQTEDVLAQIETLSSRIENLQRQRAATIRAAYFATVKLHMETRKAALAVPKKDENGPLHGLVVAFRWIGIGAVYALALGTPLVLLVALGWFLARGLRRRREEALLSRA